MVLSYVPEAPVPLTRALVTATFDLEGFATWMKTAVPATFPDAAVTLPETSNVPEPVTVATEILIVTESEAADAASGATMRNARSNDTLKAVLMAPIVVTSQSGRYI